MSDIATELSFGDADGANNEANSAELPSVSVPDGAMTIAGYVLPESITSNYRLNSNDGNQFYSRVSFSASDGSTISIRVQPGDWSVVNINTEDAITIKEINHGHFEGVIAQQNEGVTVGIADKGVMFLDVTKNIAYILITLGGVDFESSVAIINEFLNAN